MMKEEELYGYVEHTLGIDNWCYTTEYKTNLGKIDILAIQRNTGIIAVIELKVSISTNGISALIRQINGYHSALGIPTAIKWVFAGEPPTPMQIKKLISYHIEAQAVDFTAPKGNFADFRDVQYWWKYWGYPPLKERYDYAKAASSQAHILEEFERETARQARALTVMQAEWEEKVALHKKRMETDGSFPMPFRTAFNLSKPVDPFVKPGEGGFMNRVGTSPSNRPPASPFSTSRPSPFAPKKDSE